MGGERSTPREELVDGSPRYPEHVRMVGDRKAWSEKIDRQSAAAGRPGLAVLVEIIVKGTSMEQHARTEDGSKLRGNLASAPPLGTGT